MIDQKTPDPWDYLAEFIEGNAVRPPGGQQVGPPRYPLVPSVAKELRGIVEAGKRALAAERAQHQQEIADETAKRVRLAENWSKERQAANAELAQRDETIRQLQDAFARCQEVQQATAETWRIEHDQMADQTEQVNEKWLERIQAGLEAHDRGDRSPNADMFVWESVAYLLKFAAQARERDAQIARLSAEVEEQRSFKILMIKDATRLEAARDEAVSEAAALRTERDAAQQQIAALTQERDEARKKCADNERGYESLIRRYEHSVSAETARADAAEVRCATLQGAVAADEERLRQAAARAGVLFVGCDTADALADRCATLTAALERYGEHERDCSIGIDDRNDNSCTCGLAAALSGVPTP